MKELKLTNTMLVKITGEFNVQLNSDTEIELLGEYKTLNCEDEKIGFDSYIDEKGAAYAGVPGLPIPFKVEGNKVLIFPCTEDYGLVFERGIVNLQRSLRFFIMEIYKNGLHINTSNTTFHPLNK